MCSHVLAEAAGINGAVLAALLGASIGSCVGVDPRVNLELVTPREACAAFLTPVWLLTCVLPDVSVQVLVVAGDKWAILNGTRFLLVDAIMNHQRLLGISGEDVCLAVHIG